MKPFLEDLVRMVIQKKIKENCRSPGVVGASRTILPAMTSVQILLTGKFGCSKCKQHVFEVFGIHPQVNG